MPSMVLVNLFWSLEEIKQVKLIASWEIILILVFYCMLQNKFLIINLGDGASVVLECCPNLYSLGYLVFAAAGLKQVYGYEEEHDTKFTEVN